MKANLIRISTVPEDLEEGLFGQVFLFVFEVLPYLERHSIFPLWEIRSKLYGVPENDFIVIPGLIEVNKTPNFSDQKMLDINLNVLRDKNPITLGNDWDYVSKLWAKYFKVPQSIVAQANCYPDLSEALGLHYRGTDKNMAFDETNYVSENDFIFLVDDFIKTHPAIRAVFIASDESSFADTLRVKFPQLQIINSGNVTHHKNFEKQHSMAKGEHALLDCLLLSRCKYLLKCQSALSGFAKVLNPEIEAYRIAANKLAYWNKDMPYFPDSHLPVASSEDPNCQRILQRLLTDDWTGSAKVARRFSKSIPFEFKGRRRRLWSLMDRLSFGLFALSWKH